MEAKAPREHSRSPLHDFSPKERTIDEFSSQEDSAVVKVALVVWVLPPGAAQADCHIVLEKDGDDVLTIHLEVGESASANRSISTGFLVASTEKSRSRKRK